MIQRAAFLFLLASPAWGSSFLWDQLFPPPLSMGPSESLATLKGFVQEGDTLKLSCQERSRPRYLSPWQRSKVERSVLATLQLIGLRTTIPLLAQHLKAVTSDREAARALAGAVVAGYCSPNISVMAQGSILRQLKEALEEVEAREIPGIEKSFRSFCSWGSDDEKPRLLGGYLQNASIVSYLIRSLSQQEIYYDSEEQDYGLRYNPESIQAICQNFICRPVEWDFFAGQIPLALGSISLADDLKGLYCHRWRDANLYRLEGLGPIDHWIKNTTFDEFHWLNQIFLSALLKHPLPFEGAGSFAQIKADLLQDLQDHWAQKAQAALAQSQKSYAFEESLRLENIEITVTPELAISMEVNRGPFDQSFTQLGKPSVKLSFKFSERFLFAWLEMWKNDPSQKDKIQRILAAQLVPQLAPLSQLSLFRERQEELASLLAQKLLDPLWDWRRRPLQATGKRHWRIPLTIYLGPLALRSLHLNAPSRLPSRDE